MKMIKYENDKKKMIKDKDNEEGGWWYMIKIKNKDN